MVFWQLFFTHIVDAYFRVIELLADYIGLRYQILL
jgi:hypothetical protein